MPFPVELTSCSSCKCDDRVLPVLNEFSGIACCSRVERIDAEVDACRGASSNLSDICCNGELDIGSKNVE